MRLKTTLFIIGSLALAAAYFAKLSPPMAMAVVAVVVASWWILEVLPLGVTALVPLVAYPVLGLMHVREVSTSYTNPIIFLFIGGFLVAIAMEKWSLHKRLAISILSFFGLKPSRLLLGCMCATAFLSMWISNTAACMMMVSLGLALVKSYESFSPEKAHQESSANFSTAILLGIGYAATLGGLATLVGTPPNLTFFRVYQQAIQSGTITDTSITFGSWMIFAVPLSLLLLLFVWRYLTFLFIPKNMQELSQDILTREKSLIGEMRSEEKWVALIFCLMGILWVFRVDLNLGFINIPGWQRLLRHPELLDDGTIAIACAMALFFLPAKSSGTGERLLDGSAISLIPWETVFLFGGGFALARGIQDSGLAQLLASEFVSLRSVHPFFLILALTFSLCFLTEVTSNTATAELSLPILLSISSTIGVAPLSLMIPATLAASCGFMLPAGTPPNAIVFGTKRVTIRQMASVGFVINIVSVLIMSVFSYFAF